jgi:hypothetical protein
MLYSYKSIFYNISHSCYLFKLSCQSAILAGDGTVLQQKALITEEIGFWGVFLDTEGNRIGIHIKDIV